jgi:hypothetical protein
VSIVPSCRCHRFHRLLFAVRKGRG